MPRGRTRYQIMHATMFALVGIMIIHSSYVGRADDTQFATNVRDDGIDFLEQGKLVTTYQFHSGSKPILWPLVGPDDVRMSREYPMNADQPGEEHDHVHHRSLWMTYGNVDGIDYWAQGEGKGIVKLIQVKSVSNTAEGTGLIAEHHWMKLDGKEPKLKEICRYYISGTAEERIIDCEYLLVHPDPPSGSNATPAPIHFGDTKEGMFAIRVPESMRADKNLGTIINSSQEKNADAWGRPARWVDYSGPVLGPTVAGSDSPKPAKDYGITILVHPMSFHSDGFWHVRTYGLFAHNPFGVKDFVEGRKSVGENPNPENRLEGGYDLKYGDAIHLFYRVILHRNRWTEVEAETRYADFQRTPMKL